MPAIQRIPNSVMSVRLQDNKKRTRTHQPANHEMVDNEASNEHDESEKMQEDFEDRKGKKRLQK